MTPLTYIGQFGGGEQGVIIKSPDGAYTPGTTKIVWVGSAGTNNSNTCTWKVKINPDTSIFSSFVGLVDGFVGYGFSGDSNTDEEILL